MRALIARLRQPFVLVSAARAGVQALALLALLLAVAMVDVETFGAYSLAWVTTTVLNGLMYTGLYEYLMRSTAIDDERDTIFWVLIGQGVLLTGVQAAMGLGWLQWGNPMVGTMLLSLSPLPLLVAPTVWLDGLLVREQRLPLIHGNWFIVELASLAVLAVMLWRGDGALALIVSRFVPTVLMGVLMVFACPHRPRGRWQPCVLRRAVTAAWPLQGNALMGAVSNYSADFLLASYLTPAAAGAYRAASRIAMSSTELLIQPLRPINWSAFSRHEREHDKPAMVDTYLANLRFLTFVALPVLCTFGALGSRIVVAFLKPDWVVAGAIVSVLAFARAFSLFEFFLEPILVCNGRARLNFVLRTGSSLLVLVGVLIVARHGPVAVAGWQLLAGGLIALVATTLITRTLSIAPGRVLRALAYPLLMTAVCLAAVEAVVMMSPWPLRTTVIVAAVVSMVCLGTGVAIALASRVVRLPRL